ncbi:hypothetical protein N9P67_00300 [Flavobacteriaceae bacterium]|nr:hypothetical protein [Flavobacteriaceae bacterium]
MKVSLFKYYRRNKDNLNPIMYQITFSRVEQRRITTPLAIQDKYYKNGQVSSKHPNHIAINNSLRDLRNKGEEAEGKFMTGQLTNMIEVVDFLNGKQNSESVDSFLYTILKDKLTVATYDDTRNCLNGFKLMMNIKGDLMFNQVTNSLFATYNKVGRAQINEGIKSTKTVLKYGQAVKYICTQAENLNQIKEAVRIAPAFMKFPKVHKDAEYHTWEEIKFAIKNTYTIEQWQSCALWLMQFGLRGINNVDITNISDKLLKELKKERGKEKLVSVENKDFHRELYLDYKRSKSGVPMIISVFPPVLTLIKYLKNSVVYTHIDKRCKNRGILKGLEDRLNIFHYDSKNNKKFHRQLWKQRQNKFKVLSTDGISFMNCRSSFFQVAQGLMPRMDVKVLVGHTMTDSTESYASVRNPDVIRRMNEQHLEVLKKFEYEKLVRTLVEQLYKLCSEEKAPKWLLANALTENKYMLSIALDESGNIRENVYTAVKIEDKFYKYFKNQKDIEVDLPEFNPPEMEETETGEITFTAQEFEIMGLPEYKDWVQAVEVRGAKLIKELKQDEKNLKLIYKAGSKDKEGKVKVS